MIRKCDDRFVISDLENVYGEKIFGELMKVKIALEPHYPVNLGKPGRHAKISM